MANDKTFGVRISDELSEKIELLAGGNKREWFEKVVALAEMQSVKEGAAEYSKELSELEIHTARIFELVSNMVQSSIYLRDNAVKEVSDKLQQRESIIGEYQEKTKAAIEELQITKETLVTTEQEREELSKQLETQAATIENNQSLIDEYKEKIDTLSTLVNQYKGYAAENEALKTEFSERENAMATGIAEANSTIKDLESQAEQLQKQLDTTVEKHNKKIENMKVNQENKLTQLTEKKDLEREKAILEIKQQYQEKLQKVQDQYNEKLTRLYERLEGFGENTQPKKQPRSGQTKTQK